jgi:aminoglycoside/choline kinase family phosphotransferase
VPGWLPDDVRAEVERAIGPIREVADRSWPHGVTRVWQVRGSEVWWVKQHTQVRKFRQEARAYAEVVPRLAAGGFRVPGQVARFDGLRVLVLSHLPGDPARADDLALYEQAGRILAALHELPLVDQDPVPIAAALRARVLRWIDEAGEVVDDRTIDRVAEQLEDVALFDGCRRAWCHRDFSPRNWLAQDGVLGLLDFEHCSPDLPLFDFVKLADDAWRRIPATRDAVLRGYGVPWSADDRERLRRLMWLHALGTVSWAATHGDPDYERHGRGLMTALAGGWRP